MTISRRRVVLDTNCLVSALLFDKGRMSRIRVAWQAGFFTPVVCKETASELIRVLGYPKFRLEAQDVATLLEEILPFAETFTLTGRRKPIDGLADATDAVFIHLARQAETECLVSGDSHVLALKDAFSRPGILSPAEFLDSLATFFP